MANITHSHISLLEDVQRKIQSIALYSATKMKQLRDLEVHGLVEADSNLVCITAKGINFIKEIESHANEFLNNMRHSGG